MFLHGPRVFIADSPDHRAHRQKKPMARMSIGVLRLCESVYIVRYKFSLAINILLVT
jgi:hypothetical protein